VKTYRVMIKELHEQAVIVQAENEREAVRVLKEGETLGLSEGESRCITTLDTEDWRVEEVEITVKKVKQGEL